MISTVIINSNSDEGNKLYQILNKKYKSLSVVGKAESVTDGYEIIRNLKPKLVFFEHQMDVPDYKEQFGRIIEESSCVFDVIILTSAVDFEIAIHAINISAIDLVKMPIRLNELNRAVDRALKRHEERVSYEKIVRIKNHLREFNLNRNNGIGIQLLKGSVMFIKTDEILWLEAESVVTKIFLVDGTKVVACKNLGFYSKLFSIEQNYFQISNSIIANLNFVKEYCHKELKLILSNDSKLTASRRRGRLFKAFLSKNGGLSKIDNLSDPPAIVEKISQILEIDNLNI